MDRLPSLSTPIGHHPGFNAAANRFLATLRWSGWACSSDSVNRRSNARFSAAARFLTRLWSSPKLTSSCQCKQFSIRQWFRNTVPKYFAPAFLLEMKYRTSEVVFPWAVRSL
jgi:hypothetical protein